jgi:hypothetical protein
MKHYLLIIWDDIEPELLGPYAAESYRDTRAKSIRGEFGNKHGIFKFDIEGDITEVNIESYSSAFFDQSQNNLD